MKNLKDKIYEGFFKNVNVDVYDPYEWMENISFTFDQYLTKWDEKHVIKDIKNFTITFPNLYKRNNAEKVVTFDLSPYIEDLIKFDPKRVYVLFHTGIFKSDNVKINHQDKYNKEYNGDTYVDWDKKIIIEFVYTPAESPRPGEILNGREINKMRDYKMRRSTFVSAAQHSKSEAKKCKCLLRVAQFCADYPYVKDGWSELHKDFSQE